MIYKHHNTTTGIHSNYESLCVANSHVSNKDLLSDVRPMMRLHAAIVSQNQGELRVENTVCFNSQRGVLVYDDRNASGPKKDATLESVHAMGHSNPLQKGNAQEAFLIHGRANLASAGFGRVKISNCSTNRDVHSSLTVWKAAVESLVVTDFYGPDIIDIGVARPIKSLFIRNISVSQVVVRIMDGFQPDMIGRWSLDNAYRYTLVDARGGVGSTWRDDIVGEFDRPSDIVDWWHEQEGAA